MYDSKLDDDKLLDVLKKVNDEFENLETFLENDDEKCERFKGYLKTIYDYLKIQDMDGELSAFSTGADGTKQSKSANKKQPNRASDVSILPELIIDKKLVDLEQIYQQLQLYNNLDVREDLACTSISSLTKFFSKCLVQSSRLSFNVDMNEGSKKAGKSINGSKSMSHSSDSKLSINNDESDEADEEEENESDLDDDDEDDDDEDNENDSLNEMIQFSKSKVDKNTKPTFGIPDGSDSEISDFDVNEPENGADDDDDDEEEEEDGLENDQEDEEILAELNGKIKSTVDDLDSDEVDEDLVDLYDNLGDEKKMLGIGKPTKAFEEIDFDREDFGIVGDDDDEEEDDEDEQLDKQPIVNKQDKKTAKSSKSKDLFDQKSDDENDQTKKSSFEIRQEKLKETIDEIHDSMLKNVEDKPWQLKGEITAKTRPQDSLLQEYLEYDHTNKQAPIIDANFTERLEKLIKQRIKDKAFDDVERKIKPVEMQYQYKKQVVLDQEKSKVGLGDIYEQEYLKQQQKQLDEPQTNGTSKETLSNSKHEEIRKRLQSLFIKLDALSNFHFTPKAPAPELKVVSNMPTINMEEVAPVNVADSSLLAPEEIKKKIKALPKSKTEEDKKDKKKNLKTKKLVSKKKGIEKQKKLELIQALDPNNAKVNKEIAMNKLKKQAKNMSKNIKILKNDKNDKSDKAYRSSSTFFKQLQENTQIGQKSGAKKSKLSNDSDEKNKKNSKKLKL